jgi:NAD(P)H dehydrogenase (quinone)
MITVTGATGRIGGLVARALAADGETLRLVVRNPSRAPALPNADVRIASYADGAAVRQALDGAQTVLMVSAAEAQDRVASHFAFVDAAAAAGVRHLVYTSFLGAAPDAVFTLGRDHWATEEYIRASGVSFTFLRDSLYADFFPMMVGEDGAVRGPAGDGRVSAVAQADVAAAAAAILRTPDAHLNVAYDITGPAALSLDEVARIISDGTGRPVRYERETVEEAYASRASYDAPDWQVEAWVSTYTAIAAGEFARVSDAVPTLTGRPATSLAELVQAAPAG